MDNEHELVDFLSAFFSDEHHDKTCCCCCCCFVWL